MTKTKLRDKCTYVRDVRDPILTDTMRWTNIDEAPPGYVLGIENNPFARRGNSNGEGRNELHRYKKSNVNEVKRRANKDQWVGRLNTPYTGSIRPFKDKD